MKIYIILWILSVSFLSQFALGEDVDFYIRPFNPALSLDPYLSSKGFGINVKFQTIFLMGKGDHELVFKAQEKGQFVLMNTETGILIKEIKFKNRGEKNFSFFIETRYPIKIPLPSDIANIPENKEEPLKDALAEYINSIAKGDSARRKEYSKVGACRKGLKNFVHALSVVLRGTEEDIRDLTLNDLATVGKYYELPYYMPDGKKTEAYLRWIQKKLLGVDIYFKFTPTTLVLQDVNSDPRYAELVPVNATVGKAILQGSLSNHDLIDWWYFPNGNEKTFIKSTEGDIYWFLLDAPKGAGLYLRVFGENSGGYTLTVVHSFGGVENWIEVFERPLEKLPIFPY